MYTFSNDATSDIAIFDLVIDDDTWNVEVNPGDTVGYSYVTDDVYGYEYQSAVLFNADEGSYDFSPRLGLSLKEMLFLPPAVWLCLGSLALVGEIKGISMSVCTHHEPCPQCRGRVVFKRRQPCGL